MKINNAIRKVVAVGAGATMMGATMFGAMAADLTSYPSPFVSAGKYNAMIVFGDKAATADVVGSIDLATNLAYAIKQPSSASGVASTTIEDGAAIETSGQKLYMGDGFSQVKQSMTDTELPALLKKGSVTDTDGTSYDYVQQIKVFNSTIDFGKTPDNLDDPVLFLTTDGTGYNYTTEINFPTAVDTTKLLGKKLTFFGKEWTVSSNANELAVNGTSGLVLYGGGVQKIMTAGDTATVDVEGTQTVVNIVGVNADVTPSTAMITVNGESKQLAAGNTETLGGVRIYVKQIFTYTVPAKQGAVELFIGTDKLILRENQNLRKASKDVDGTMVIVSRSVNQVSKISVVVTPKSMTPQVRYLKVGDSITDPVWGTFKIAFTGVTPGLEDATRDVVKVYPGSEDRLTLEFTNKDNQKYRLNVMNSSSSGSDSLVGLGDGSYKLHTTALGAQSVAENEYFILGSSEYTHIMQLRQISLSSSTPSIKVKDVADGSELQTLSLTTASYGNYTTLTLDGVAYTLRIESGTPTLVNVSNGVTADLYTKGGMKIALPTSETPDSYKNISFLQETSYNGGSFTNVGATSLGTGLIVSRIHSNTSNTYDMQVDSPTGDGLVSNLVSVGTSYDKRDITTYGTYVKYNTDSDVLQLFYPTNAASYQVFVAPTLAMVKTTGVTTTGAATYTVNEISVGAAKLSSEALAADPDLSMNNYILVGGPCANPAAAKVMGITNMDTCAAGFEAGKAKIKLYENAATGKVALLIAGMDAIDTTRAARAVKAGKLSMLSAGAKEAVVTTVTDTPTLTVVTQ